MFSGGVPQSSRDDHQVTTARGVWGPDRYGVGDDECEPGRVRGGRVGGTGRSVAVGAGGRFAFAFERQSDGVNARLSLASTSALVR